MLRALPHAQLYNVTAPCTIALQFLVQMWIWNRMAEALWHFNASLMSVISPARNIFSSLQGTVTRELSLMAQLIQVSLF